MYRPDKSLIAMLHTGPLPGTPRGGAAVRTLAGKAMREARLLADAGVDALLLENMHDVPYVTQAGPEIVAAMTVIGLAVRHAVDLPLGVQILAGANQEALAVAAACDAAFVRVENYVFAHVADEGLMPSASAGPLLRYRRHIGADNIAVFADIKKKHAGHTLTSDIDLAETARAAAFCQADGVVVTGPATGQPTSIDDIRAVRAAVPDLPVLVGSGITPEQLGGIWPLADGFIVGSYLKQDGRWSNPLDPDRVQRMIQAVNTARAL